MIRWVVSIAPKTSNQAAAKIKNIFSSLPILLQKNPACPAPEPQVSREIHGRWRLDIQQRAKAFQQGATHARDIGLLQKSGERSPLQRSRELAENRHMQPPLRINHLRLSQRPSFQLVAISIRFHPSREGRHRVTTGNFRKQWQRFVAQAIAHRDGLRIARVLTPRVLLRNQPIDEG